MFCNLAWLTSVIYPSCLQYHGRGNGFIPIAEYGLEFTKNTKQWKKKTPVRLLYSGRNHYDLLVWHSCRTIYFLVPVIIPWLYYFLFLYLCFFLECFYTCACVPFFSHQWNWFSYQNINFEFEIYMSFACFHLAYFSLVFLTKIEVLWQQFHGWV